MHEQCFIFKLTFKHLFFILGQNLNGKDHLEDLGIDVMVILKFKCTLKMRH